MCIELGGKWNIRPMMTCTILFILLTIIYDSTLVFLCNLIVTLMISTIYALSLY